MRSLLSLWTVAILIILTLIFLTPANASSIDMSGKGTPPIDTDNYWYIENDLMIIRREEFSNGNIVINSTGKLIIGENGDLILNNINIGFNTTGNGTPTIHVLKGGKLEIINLTTRIIQSPSSELKYEIIIDPGANLNLTDCYFNLENSYNKSQIRISSSNFNIENCTFGNGLTGLFLENISNASITNCTFHGGNHGVKVLNSSNLRFINCEFFDNYDASCRLVNSSHLEPIELINCTIIKPTDPHKQKSLLGFKLENSKLSLINISFFHLNPINLSLELDEDSELVIYWYLNLRTIDEKLRLMGETDIVIINNSTTEVFTGKTNENGQLKWILLKTRSISSIEKINHNPFKITAFKNKDKYKGSIYISLKSSNTGKELSIELTKKEKDDDEFDWQNSIFMICICIMVIVTVFILMLSINLYLARKKAGLNRTDGIYIGDNSGKAVRGDLKGSDINKEFITCSECGTQVTENATFCPHCGEYFEGDEFRCPGCNHKLSEQDSKCPKCGRIFKESLIESGDIVESSKKKSKSDNIKLGEKLFCSQCGAVVKAGDNECPGCGMNFNKKPSEISKLKIKNGKNRAYKITSEEEKILNKEKISRKAKEKPVSDLDIENMYMCSICGESVSEKTKKCPKCGTELE